MARNASDSHRAATESHGEGFVLFRKTLRVSVPPWLRGEKNYFAGGVVGAAGAAAGVGAGGGGGVTGIASPRWQVAHSTFAI